MIYVYPCDEQTCAAFDHWFTPVSFAYVIYDPLTCSINYVDRHEDIEQEALAFRSISGGYQHQLPSHPPLFIYDPTQPEWQI